MKTHFLIFSLLFSIIVFIQPGFGGEITKGKVKGRLLDSATKTPLIGANVLIVGTQFGAATDTDGNFLINAVPVGNYSLKFSYIGYETKIKPDVIVRSARFTFVEAELKAAAVELDQVVITGGYFAETDEQISSITNFSYEEIRRAPGTAGDISRVVLSLAKVNDQSNGLIVRGGSPIENAFFVDNIEIPNINHFPTQGTSSGPIGILNVDFIRDVNFSTGGFSAIYGDKLSSVMNIKFREGNREEFDGQLDLNFAGFGGVFEGPLFGKSGSYLISARRSFLDLLVKSFDAGTTVAPVYGDLQWKVTFNLNPLHQLSFLGIWGDDHNNPDYDSAVENDMLVYGNQDITENTTGLNWRAVWGKSGYSNTSVSHTSTKFKEDFFETGSQELLIKNRSIEHNFKFRNVNHLFLSKQIGLEIGLEAKHLISDYDNFYAEYTDALGEFTPESILDKKITGNKFGAFANLELKLLPALTTNFGVRTDYFSFTENLHIAPRFGIEYRFTERTSLVGATGLYHQSLPLLLLAQNSANKNLKDLQAVHYVLGVHHFLSDDAKLSLEVYQKDYDNFPIDPSQPSLFLLDELFYRYGFFFNHENLTDSGKASAKGVEVILQKKLAENFYGLASAAYFRTKYTGGDGVERNRVFDNRFIFSMEGGYKPNNKWEFSLRWIYAGGTPYTPFDPTASEAINRGVLDENRINGERLPAYHSLNIRFDRRFYNRGSNLVFYLSVWNAYNRKNIASYFWNQVENKQDQLNQWTMLPIFGLEYEF